MTTETTMCPACNQNEGKYVVSSIFGGFSYALCDKCLMEGRAPYNEMVTYISCAGNYPEDINDTYQKVVEHQLKLHNISRDKFIEDVRKMNEQLCLKGF